MEHINFQEDKLHEECGVFGIFGSPDAATLTTLGLHALQHRGQEGAGIVTFDGDSFHGTRRPGLVSDFFTRENVIKKLSGSNAIGHVRYSTTGDSIVKNIQPFYADLSSGGFACAHNGNLTNASMLRQNLVNDGAIFQSTSDTETILQLVARSKREYVTEKLIDALFHVQRA